jgi:prepilin-type processing-associated H-X9-DG protein
MSGSPPEDFPPRWQFSLRRLLLLPVAVAAVFAPIAAFGAPGILLGLVIGWVALGVWFRLGMTSVFAGLLLFLLFLALALPAVNSTRVNSRRSHCANILSEIAKALLQYELVYGKLPAAVIADKDGRPMHSWRVLVLPYLGREDLYKQYRFDEPWNGPNNRKLHSIPMPIYRCPSDGPVSQTITSYVAVVGAGTAWPGSTSTKLSDFADGPSQTLLVVETANSGIHWMEPKDLDFAQMPLAINAKSGKGISSKHAGGANVAFADGHVEYLRDDQSPELLHALLTIHGGEHLIQSQDGSRQLADPAKRQMTIPRSGQ